MEGHPPSAADVRSLQDKAAGMADAAADEASARSPAMVAVSGEYSPLPQGPAVTAETLVEAVLRMATTFESQADMTPAHVAQVTALGMLPDSQHQRTGIQGSIGAGRYEFAVWKPYRRHPGTSIELTVRPADSCEISFESLHNPLVAAGFSVTKNAVGFKPMVYFARAVADGLGLYVILSTDSHTDPLCVTRVRLEMEPIDG